MLTYVASLYRNPLPVEAVVERLGLGSCGRTTYRRLSGGQQQRLGLAMAIIGRPELVFLDEPTAGLDPQARRATWELIEEMSRDGVTVVLTTHYMEEAERLASHLYVVDAGQVADLWLPRRSDRDTGPGSDSVRRQARTRCQSACGLALPEDCFVEESPAGVYRVSGDVTPHTLATVTAWCASLDVMPDELGIERRTLEDVFLDLTGRSLRG